MNRDEVVPREMQCAYRSKFCDAPRATKLDGTLHKLCDFHRHKANANQQRLHRRKKRILEQQVATATATATASTLPVTPVGGCSLSKRARLSPKSPRSTMEPFDPVTFPTGFNLLEVKILEVLLFGSEGATLRPPQSVRVIKDDDWSASGVPPTPSMTPVPLLDSVWSVTL
uniref:SBP-type domain-containing protein n=1 Tax=Peronospora matthiolae TaxID=2874970 RepID=A0AAV1UN44_9STRA